MLHAYIHVQRIYATLQQFPYLGTRYLGYEQGDIIIGEYSTSPYPR